MLDFFVQLVLLSPASILCYATAHRCSWVRWVKSIDLNCMLRDKLPATWDVDAIRTCTTELCSLAWFSGISTMRMSLNDNEERQKRLSKWAKYHAIDRVPNFVASKQLKPQARQRAAFSYSYTTWLMLMIIRMRSDLISILTVKVAQWYACILHGATDKRLLMLLLYWQIKCGVVAMPLCIETMARCSMNVTIVLQTTDTVTPTHTQQSYWGELHQRSDKILALYLDNCADDWAVELREDKMKFDVTTRRGERGAERWRKAA